MEDPASCEKCGDARIRQDEDVLDTWFSSALWPFSTLGWPAETPALKKYYPTSVLVTGFDIIFFWVARMIMMGLKFMKDVPFRDVYIHALVRDEQGHKMSKSRGNVIDPLIMMDRYGTDAFRFTLAIFAAQGRDVILSEKRIEGYRAFCNKIWNATRYILMNLGDDFRPGIIDTGKLENFDRWILHRLNRAIGDVNTALEEYRFNEAAQSLYDFWWHEFCDWYLELTKPRIYASAEKESSAVARQVLYHVLKTGLRLLHPFMPFISEEIWSRIKEDSEGLLITAPWPEIRGDFSFPKEAESTELFKDIVYKIRNIRGEMNIPPDRKPNVVFKTTDRQLINLINAEYIHIQSNAKVDSMTVDGAYAPAKTDASAVLPGLEIYIPLTGIIDIEREKARLEKEIARVKSEYSKTGGKLGNESFLSKARPDVIEKERAKEEELRGILVKLEESLAKLG
jgi:valyl-tRNA synthetase